MKTKYMLSGIALCIMTLIIPRISTAQSLDALQRQIIFKTRPNSISFNTNAITANIGDIYIQETLRQCFVRSGVTTIKKAFPHISPSDTMQVLSDGRIYRPPDVSDIYIVEVEQIADIDRIVLSINEIPTIVSAVRNYITPSTRDPVEFEPDDPFYQSGSQWNMKMGSHIEGYDINATYAWALDSGTGSAEITMAIIDFHGVDIGHDDLKSQTGSTRAFDSDDYSGFNPSNSHGTRVAGIATATGNNDTGIAGIDWNCMVYNFYFNPTTNDDFIEIIRAAIQDPVNAKVICFSGGIQHWWDTVRDELMAVYSADCSIIVAGPENTAIGSNTRLNHMGSFIHTVGALDRDGTRPSYIRDQDKCHFTDIAAPGGDIAPQNHQIRSLQNNGGTSFIMGTSASTPHSAGVAAVMRGKLPSLHNYDIEWIQKLTASPIPDIDFEYVGYGLLNAYECLRVLEEPNELYHETESINEIDTNVTQLWTTSPDWWRGDTRLAAGAYIVDIHEFRGSTTFDTPYVEPPLAWLSQTGYSYTSPQDPSDFHYQYINEVTRSETNVDLRTYFYEVKNRVGSGQSINRWIPYNPYELPTVLSVLGELTDGLPLPSAPSGLVASYNESKMKYQITWNRSPSEQQVDKYWLKRAFDGGAYVTVNDNIPNSGSGSTVTTFDYELETVPPGTEEIWYRVAAHNAAGWSGFCVAVCVFPGGGGPESAEATIVQLPNELTLEQNYPNPFNPDTQIKFGIPTSSHVRLRIMNIRGQTLRTLVDDEKSAGWHTVMWDGRNEGGDQVASGIYLYLIEVEGKNILMRMTLIR
ncbi:S8 family serine peptidase [Gemmatimonadota bacterium]